MKILVLNYEYPPIGGGGGVMAKDLVERLAERGHEIDVVTMHFGQLAKEEKQGNTTVYRVPCLRKKEGVCYPWEQFTYICSAYSFIKKKLDVSSYNVCHAHFIIPTGVVAFLLKKKFGLPYILTAHGSDVEGYNQNRFKLMHVLLRSPWKGLVRAAKQTVSPSAFLLDLLEKQDKSDKYKIIPNGIDMKYYDRIGQKYKKEKSMLVMCRLQKAKGVDTVIKAFSRLRDKTWTLHIMGDGPYREALEQLAEETQCKERVVFHGWVAHGSSLYEELLGKTYIYLSGSHFENCPMSVLEAAISGSRLVISDIPAHHQMIDETDAFARVEEIDDYVQKMEMNIKDYESNTLKKRDMQRYDWENVVAAYEEILKNSACK